MSFGQANSSLSEGTASRARRDRDVTGLYNPVTKAIARATQITKPATPGPSALQAGTKSCRYGSRNKLCRSWAFCTPGRDKGLPVRLKRIFYHSRVFCTPVRNNGWWQPSSPAKRDLTRKQGERDRVASTKPRALYLQSTGYGRSNLIQLDPT